jgi:hypothetical protein
MFGQNLDTVACIRYIRFLCSNLAAWQLNVKSKLLNQGEKKKKRDGKRCYGRATRDREGEREREREKETMEKREK